MLCIQCQKPARRNGHYIRPSDQKRIQRYQCKPCGMSFSDQTLSHDHRLRVRHFNQTIFRLIASGLSQRRCALILNTKPAVIARRVVRFGAVAERNLALYRRERRQVERLMLDEMESFEHTKCKPVTIPIAVEAKTRKILALDVAPIAAKGYLAKISRIKYGRRPCQRARALGQVFADLQTCCAPDVHVRSDESVHYPRRIKSYFPSATHEAHKGRRGCIVGQGEMKAGGWDPLFSLNHTYAMIRDNVKTLSRRTWCTTKRIDRLRALIYIYAWFHNLYLEGRRRIRLYSLAINN